MKFLDYFQRGKNSSASVAKERLQIIVAHERAQRNQPDYLPQLRKDLLEVVARYVKIDQDQVNVTLEHQGNCSVLELNVTLPSAH